MRPERVAMVVVALGVSMALVIAAMVEADLPGDRVGVRRFLTPEIGRAIVGQRFAMTRPGLDAIELRPVAVGEPRGAIEVVLRVADTEGIARRGSVAAAALARGERYRWQFTPLTDSAGRRYDLELTAPGGPSGIALWATRGERLEDAALTLNGRERWADLAFQAHASDGQVATWPDFGRPNVLFSLALLGISWYVLTTLLRRLSA
jgi:hypothetical protein